jgi:hypothetical protein
MDGYFVLCQRFVNIEDIEEKQKFRKKIYTCLGKFLKFITVTVLKFITVTVMNFELNFYAEFS